MTWLLTLAKQLLLWALPKIADIIGDYYRAALQAVEWVTDLNPDATAGEVRDAALQRLSAQYPQLPEWALRTTLEQCIRWRDYGVTTDLFDKIDSTVADMSSSTLSGTEKRNLVIERIGSVCPDIAESAVREIVELGVARLKSSAK